MTTRWKLTIEYDGRPFSGWQRQIGPASVQQALETAIHAFTGEDVRVYGAGRTDAGVHATGQVAHVDIEKPFDENSVRNAINALIRPHPISVLNAEMVSAEFHARFSATGRRYKYRILNRRSPPALDIGFVWHVPLPLDAAAMRASSTVFVGHHDFSTFRSAQCQAHSPMKTLEVFDVATEGEEIVIRVASRSFLHHQVRSMVGSLKLVGEAKWTMADLEAARDARDRKECGPVAPPEGLSLTHVEYAAGYGVGAKSISSTSSVAID